MYRLARLIAWIMLPVSGRTGRLAEELASIPGEGPCIHSPLEIRALVYRALISYVSCELEVLVFPVLNKENISSYVTCTGLEHLDKALVQGRGAMLLFGHFGANQIVMPAIGYSGYKMCQLSAPATVWKEVLPNREFSPLEERMMQERWKHELSLPVRHINIFGSLKEAFRCLQRNEVLGVAIDGGGGKERIALDFLGRRALFSPGAVDMARRTGCAVLPTFVVRDSNGRNTMIIEPSLDMSQDGVGGEFIQRNMQLFVKRLEDYVLRRPDLYVNFLALRSFMAENGDTPFMIKE
jgi:KDO2-lipid IV(A) lauroyltransferase